MFPLKKILCPTDFSDFSVRALKTSVELADKFKAKIILCHVITDIPNMGTTYGVMNYHPQMLNIQEFIKEMEKVSNDRLDKLAKEYVKESIVCEKKVSTGTPSDVIVETSEQKNVDLIVLTTHGHTGLKRIFLGSVAEGVIRHAPCPVLSIRIKDED